jgi:polysaccharide export outer membrane protein
MQIRLLDALTGGLVRFAVALTLVFSLTPSAQGQTMETYGLHPGDLVSISVWRELELQGEFLIPPDGLISFPLAGQIVAAGRTAAQIQNEITEKLKAYIPEAVVTVSIVDIQGNRIYVIGQVNNPGSFVMNTPLNVVQALSLAQGMTPFAQVNDIIVLRTLNGRQQVFKFRYNDINRGRDLEQNITLQSGDVVLVP